MAEPRAYDIERGAGTGVVLPPLEAPSRLRGRRDRDAPLDLDGWPPSGERDGGSGGGGGGGDDGDGGGGDGTPDGDEPRRAPDGSAELGLGLAMVAMATLFAAFLGAYLLLRRNAVEWPPAGAPGPPNGLWFSTLALVACSGTLARGLAARRRGERRMLLHCLAWSLALGVAFLCLQAWLWSDLRASGLAPSTNGYGAIFFTLTGLHAAHVLGGVGYLGKVLGTALRDARGGSETSVRLCAAYWHFMGVIWLVVFGVLYFLR